MHHHYDPETSMDPEWLISEDDPLVGEVFDALNAEGPEGDEVLKAYELGQKHGSRSMEPKNPYDFTTHKILSDAYDVGYSKARVDREEELYEMGRYGFRLSSRMRYIDLD